MDAGDHQAGLNKPDYTEPQRLDSASEQLSLMLSQLSRATEKMKNVHF